VGAGKNVHGTRHVVRRNGTLLRLRHGGNLFGLGDATRPDQIRHDHFGSTSPQVLPELILRHEPLGNTDGGDDLLRQRYVVLDVCRLDQLLLPHHVEGVHRLTDADRVVEVPAPVTVVGDVELIADSVAHRLDRLEHERQVFRPQVDTTGQVRERICEGPLHGGDAIV